ncbi:MAG TPA: hypothetical protein VJ837_01810 [Candidatus Paceibacterota bacterium]|nr:hypothetical protein [Candidatus Paceibacterota bacterium]
MTDPHALTDEEVDRLHRERIERIKNDKSWLEEYRAQMNLSTNGNGRGSKSASSAKRKKG